MLVACLYISVCMNMTFEKLVVYVLPQRKYKTPNQICQMFTEIHLKVLLKSVYSPLYFLFC